ncbi:hypothetical protein F0L17_05940 [Streptomyces sp. TRM43335]|uniref:CU044_5270 family protein n=1 Tax=Streptomyces taklimakanensis TaxID=2569853 RepID=A0A6G2B9V3_9ACTN|nr:CU044_5270 family protein [Streptomyces taklimakanensis]MTE18682.1 hypothetical protein [Streptomyces taklimakanensis]
MREIELLGDWEPEEAPLTDEARARVRARLLTAARSGPYHAPEPTGRRRRPVPVVALGGALAAAVAAGVLAAADLGGDPGGLLVSPPASSSFAPPPAPPSYGPGPAEILRRAAAYEREHSETVVPRDGRFVYVRETVEERIAATGETRTRTDESWMPVGDSRPSAGAGAVWPPRTWRELEALPTDPDELLRLLRDEIRLDPDTGRPATADDRPDAGDFLVELLRDTPVMPEGLRAAAYEALARIPGITAGVGREHVEGVEVSYANPWAEGAAAETVFVFDAETHVLLDVRDERVVDGQRVRISSRLEEYAVVDGASRRP